MDLQQVVRIDKRGRKYRVHRKDFTGKVFGNLTVLGQNQSNEKLWDCRCKCGKILPLQRSTFVEKKRTACSKDCMFKDYGGMVFGDHIKVIEKVPKPDHISKKGRYWKCVCLKCNLISIRRSGSFGNACSCHYKLNGDTASMRSLIARYKASAKKRNFPFDLSNDMCCKLFKSNCYYCNMTPLQLHYAHPSSMPYCYNGIDRKDSRLGYIESNAVPCCKVCNLRKGKMSFDEFKNWINLVHNTLFTKGYKP